MRLIILAIVLSIFTFSCTSTEKEEYHLVDKMTSYQYYSHKLWLSGEARNSELIDFYLHEMEEVAEELIDKKVQYDGYDIGNLTEKMLLPAIERLEESNDSINFSKNYQLLIKACNSCHIATDHSYIEISIPKNNPYNQKF